MPTDSPPPTENRSPLRAERPAPAARDNGAYQILAVRGIPIRLHWTFLALLIYVTVATYSGGSAPNARPPLGGPLFVIGLFACVVLHELGHALTALRYGIRTRDIVLYPIGGIASLETMPHPREELWIALAGPAVNVVIAAALYAVLIATGHPPHLRLDGPTDLPAELFYTNVALVIFNMIPAFPMDGGRVLRSLLARVTDETSATVIAARVGQFFAVLMGVAGLFGGNVGLVVIALFVYFGAGQEAAAFQTRALTEGHRVREAMMREFHTLTVGTTLREAKDVLLAGYQQDFPILHGDEVVGVLSRSGLLRGMATEGPDSYVAGVMERDFVRVRPDDDLSELLTQAQALQSGPILVMDGDIPDESRLVGMITQENLLEFLMLTQLQQRENAPRR